MTPTNSTPGKPATPFVIGVTGGVGSGKSAAAELLARHGGKLVVADALGHEALRDPAVRSRIVGRWGERVLESGEVDRRKLGSIVFADETERRALEAISHPWIVRRMKEEVATARLDPAVGFVVIDAALLVEAGWDAVCDRVVYVEAAPEVRQERVRVQRGWGADELRRREAAQLPLTRKRSRADHVIDNSSTLDHLDRQVQELLSL